MQGAYQAHGRGRSADNPVPEGLNFTRRRFHLVLLAVCALGVSAMMTQLTLMRELLSVFSGNEMILGIVLGNWLLLTGIGSYLGRTASRLKRPLNVLVLAQVLVGILPVVDLVLVRTMRNVVFVRGSLVGISETVISCFVLLLPYCLISGYLLTLACRVLARADTPLSIGRVYFLDNIGDILGGAVFTFVLIHFFGHFGILYFPGFLNLFFAAMLSLVFGSKRLLLVPCAVLVGFLAVVLLVDLEDRSTQLQYSGQKVVYRGNSPYGELVVTESEGQYDFIENGVPVISTHNIEEIEETVHYAMVQRPTAKRVLLISGGVSGTAKEILKYDVEQVDYVELDPLIVDVGRRYLAGNLSDRRIRVENTDGRLFVKQTDRRYDVVIVDIPDPSTSQLNRFYTLQFFREVKRVLTDGGVLSFSLGHYENYVSKELAKLIAVAHRTVGSVFRNVTIVPGGRIFFLASDRDVTRDIAARIEAAGIQTHLVNRHYLRGTLTPDRIADVERPITENAPINKDFSPVLYYYHLRHWMSQFRYRFGALEGALILILAIYLFRIRPVSFAIFTTGFSASGLVVVLLLGFQILYGSVYHKVGLIVTMFMIGLAVGSFTMNRMLAHRTRKDLVKLELVIAAYAVVLPFILMGLGGLGGATVSRICTEVVLPLLTLVLAALVGLEFPLAGKADFRGITATAARLYTADFVGACLGALLVSTFLIPVIGVVWVCVLVGALNAVSGAVVWLTGKG